MRHLSGMAISGKSDFGKLIEANLFASTAAFLHNVIITKTPELTRMIMSVQR